MVEKRAFPFQRKGLLATKILEDHAGSFRLQVDFWVSGSYTSTLLSHYKLLPQNYQHLQENSASKCEPWENVQAYWEVHTMMTLWPPQTLQSPPYTMLTTVLIQPTEAQTWEGLVPGEGDGALSTLIILVLRSDSFVLVIWVRNKAKEKNPGTVFSGTGDNGKTGGLFGKCQVICERRSECWSSLKGCQTPVQNAIATTALQGGYMRI